MCNPVPYVLGITGILTVVLVSECSGQTPVTALGRQATPFEIDAWGPIIGPDGNGLPPGGSTAAEGLVIYNRRCSACHGPTGREGPDDQLVGGQGSLTSDRPRKTVGSYWPAATTLWDYINRAMPFQQLGSLSFSEVYAVVAYILYLNDIISENERVDINTLAKIKMPNRNGFAFDRRPAIAAEIFSD